MPDPETVRSTARVPTDRPARYGKQLAAHLGRRTGGGWDDATGTGWVDLGGHRATLTGGDGVLDLEVTGTPDDVARLEDVVGRHLVRFGARDELVVRWTRSDGTAGTVQEDTGEG